MGPTGRALDCGDTPSTYARDMARYLVQHLTNEPPNDANWTASTETFEEAKARADKVWSVPSDGFRQSIIDGKTEQEWVRGEGDLEWRLVNLGAAG
jgi:hypothetical protein